jgi:hypothetical protein
VGQALTSNRTEGGANPVACKGTRHEAAPEGTLLEVEIHRQCVLARPADRIEVDLLGVAEEA